MDGLTLIRQHFHEERVLLPAIDDVRGIHPLRQTPRAALHPAWRQRGISSSACRGTQIIVARYGLGTNSTISIELCRETSLPYLSPSLGLTGRMRPKYASKILEKLLVSDIRTTVEHIIGPEVQQMTVLCYYDMSGCARTTGHACMNSRRHDSRVAHSALQYSNLQQCVSACWVHTHWLGIRTSCCVWGRASHLGIIPPAMIPSATSSRTCRMSRDTNFVATSSLSWSTPGTSVMRISFSAFSEAAICMRINFDLSDSSESTGEPEVARPLHVLSQGIWHECCTGRRRCMACVRGL